MQEDSGKTTVCEVAHVDPTQSNQVVDWNAFLASSDNGTLFHDLRFLAYHPCDRFDTHHLIFRRNGKLLALFPAAIVTEPDGRRLLRSPYGGSVGGFVLSSAQHADSTIQLVNCLQNYVTDQGLNGIETRTGPNVYAACPNDTLSFALAASGFILSRRWLTHIIPLPAHPEDVLNKLPSRRRRGYIQSAIRHGLEVNPVGVSRLAAFYQMLQANRAKHGGGLTHTLSELERLYELVPDHMRLFVCELQGQMIAGSLVFELNNRVSYSFYPCHDEKFEEYRPAALTTIRVAEYYSARGFKYLDLGPSTFDDFAVNHGLARFKEDMGGIGFCRDTWRWEATK
jgi:hypothetical protein